MTATAMIVGRRPEERCATPDGVGQADNADLLAVAAEIVRRADSGECATPT